MAVAVVGVDIVVVVDVNETSEATRPKDPQAKEEEA